MNRLRTTCGLCSLGHRHTPRSIGDRERFVNLDAKPIVTRPKSPLSGGAVAYFVGAVGSILLCRNPPAKHCPPPPPSTGNFVPSQYSSTASSTSKKPEPSPSVPRQVLDTVGRSPF